MPDDLRLTIPGCELAALGWGPPDGRRVLALHGWLDNAASFGRIAPLLDGIRLIAVDLPGHGRSAHRPPGWSYHFADWPADAVAVADALDWPEFHLLGHSMGAGIASLVPAVAPQRVCSVALIEGLGPMSREPNEAPAALAAALQRERRFDSNPRVFADFDQALAARLVRSDLDRKTARALVERGTTPVDGGCSFRHDRRLQLPSRMRFSEDQVAAFLKAVACPALAVRATRGWPFPEAVMRARQRAVAGLEIVEVDGGHHVHLECPAEVAARLQRFWGSVAG